MKQFQEMEYHTKSIYQLPANVCPMHERKENETIISVCYSTIARPLLVLASVVACCRTTRECEDITRIEVRKI